MEQESPPILGETREKKVGKTHFVEHRTGFHIYHSFHRLWIFLVCMLQVLNQKSHKLLLAFTLLHKRQYYVDFSASWLGK